MRARNDVPGTLFLVAVHGLVGAILFRKHVKSIPLPAEGRSEMSFDEETVKMMPDGDSAVLTEALESLPLGTPRLDSPRRKGYLGVLCKKLQKEFVKFVHRASCGLGVRRRTCRLQLLDSLGQRVEKFGLLPLLRKHHLLEFDGPDLLDANAQLGPRNQDEEQSADCDEKKGRDAELLWRSRLRVRNVDPHDHETHRDDHDEKKTKQEAETAGKQILRSCGLAHVLFPLHIFGPNIYYTAVSAV